MAAEQEREPLSGSLSQASMPAGAVFLSYASEDAPAAERIAMALRSAGVQVWFDKSELRGGDAWDRSIRQQIHDCRLFIAVISAHTEARDEGYFRREWKLAVERTRDMADKKAFLVPVVIDDTSERSASVPEKFHELHWTRLPGGATPPTFVERVRKLLLPEPSTAGAAVAPISLTSTALHSRSSVASPSRSKAGQWAIGGALALALAYVAVDKLWVSRHLPPPTPPAAPPTRTATSAPPTAAAFNPPPHSIAVLPFVNMSGDKEQEYFSEGLTEELLNSLSRINELQVAARTSSFSFQGEHPDIATVAHKLNVGAVLEGSVRRAGHTVRITAQLVNGVTGFHLWSQTYDRDLGDVLQLQTDIATAVASALKVTLLEDEAAKIEAGGTHNPAAFDAYLRATKAYSGALDKKRLEAAIAGYTEAIHLDPNYAIVYADRAVALLDFGRNWADEAEVNDYTEKAEADARRAIALAPDLAEGHLALANKFEQALEFNDASREYERALALAPGSAKLLRYYGGFAVQMGRTDAGIAALHRAVVLDPLNSLNYFALGESLFLARRLDQAIQAFAEVRTLDPSDVSVNAWAGFAYILSGDLQNARTVCESATDINTPFCLAIVYAKLGRRADAETMLTKYLAAQYGSSLALLGMIYAQRGDIERALHSLEAALRHRDPYLEYLKTNGFYDPLRHEPRFQAIERALKFPD